jgi:hypothetical protein
MAGNMRGCLSYSRCDRHGARLVLPPRAWRLTQLRARAVSRRMNHARPTYLVEENIVPSEHLASLSSFSNRQGSRWRVSNGLPCDGDRTVENW